VTPAVILAVCLISGKYFRDNRLSVPGILLLSLLIFYGMLYFSGISREETAADGLLPLIESTGLLVPIFHFDYFAQINWIASSDQIGGIVVVALLCSMMLLRDVSGIELIARDDLNPDHELQAIGYTNIINSFFGGFPASTMSQTLPWWIDSAVKIGSPGLFMPSWLAPSFWLALNSWESCLLLLSVAC
jgi:MFS superfamily sulfate permease-like transporter